MRVKRLWPVHMWVLLCAPVSCSHRSHRSHCRSHLCKQWDHFCSHTGVMVSPVSLLSSAFFVCEMGFPCAELNFSSAIWQTIAWLTLQRLSRCPCRKGVLLGESEGIADTAQCCWSTYWKIFHNETNQKTDFYAWTEWEKCFRTARPIHCALIAWDRRWNRQIGNKTDSETAETGGETAGETDGESDGETTSETDETDATGVTGEIGMWTSHNRNQL